MSSDLDAAIKSAARTEGITAGAWVRRTLLERVELQSERDERSGRPLIPPDGVRADIATAIRELAGVSTALSVNDRDTAKSRLHLARSLLIPIALGRLRR